MHPSTNTTNNIEEKLLLLESRFTEPSPSSRTSALLGGGGLGVGPQNSTSNSYMSLLSPQQNNNDNEDDTNNSIATYKAGNGIGGTSSGNAAATANANSHHSILSSTSASQHSFTFDTPSSLSNPLPPPVVTVANNNRGNNNNNSNNNNSWFKGSRGSSSKATTTTTTTTATTGGSALEAVERATERHMAKVGNIINISGGCKSGSTNNAPMDTTTQIPIAAAGNGVGADVNSAEAADAVVRTTPTPSSNTKSNNNNNNNKKKPPRKSKPVKRESASVKENHTGSNLLAATATVPTNNKNNNNNKKKKKAINNSSKDGNVNNTTKRQQQHQQQQNKKAASSKGINEATITTTTNNNNKRPREAKTATAVGVAAVAPTGTTVPQPAVATTTTANKSPTSYSRGAIRSPSAAAAAAAGVMGGGGGEQKKQKKNASIHDFFKSATTSSSTTAAAAESTVAGTMAVAGAVMANRNNNNSNTNNNKPPPQVAQMLSSTSTTTRAPPVSITSSSSNGSSNHNSNNEALVQYWQRKCGDLEKANQETQQQLQAVHNNRTILHSALQSALNTSQSQVTQLQEQIKSERGKSSACLEVWIREESTRQATDLREKLAADGIRLGRIVTTRSGLRTMERWEDGHACKQVREKKKKIERQIQEMQQRYELAVQTAEKLQNNHSTAQQQQQKPQSAATTTINSSGKKGGEQALSPAGETSAAAATTTIAGIAIQTRLEAVEAVEAASFHLQTLQRQLQEVDVEEHALQEEKMTHIRAVKRVSMEDSSRFRSRPKLNDRYVLRSLLGKGGFSEVWRAYDLLELREVAVKIHQLDPRWSDAKKENYTKHVSREYEIHRSVRHPRIVSLFDVFEIDNNSFSTVLECCNGTDLDTLLKRRRQLPEREARAILLQILLGMQYLCQDAPDGSRQGIIHYDLKPGNILFDEHGDAKITDFGLSKIVENAEADSMELTSQGAGTYWYLPPECFVMDDTVRISNKVDVWSIGVIFYQMLYGKRPFGDGITQDHLLKNNTMLQAARDVHIPDEPKVSDQCKQFLGVCLTYEQTYRPTIAQLCEHEYVLSMNQF